MDERGIMDPPSNRKHDGAIDGYILVIGAHQYKEMMAYVNLSCLNSYVCFEAQFF